MRNTLVTSVLSLLMASCLGYAAEDVTPAQVESVGTAGTALTLSVGAVYRHFKEAKAYGHGPDSRQLYEGRNLGAFNERAVMTTTAKGKDFSCGTAAGFAPIISLSFDGALWTGEDISISPELSFQYFELSGRKSLAVQEDTTYYYTSVSHPEFGEVAGTTDTAVTSSRMNLDLRLYVLSLGANMDYRLNDTLSFFVAGGPTLSFASLESRFGADHRETTKALPGCYASAGATCHLTERWSATAGVRYDWVFQDIKDSNVRQELSGFGGIMKIGYAF